jgi:hypothetical protein
MDIVTTGAPDATPVHDALNEVIPLHSVFVSSPVSEMSEGGLSEFVVFELPEML